MVVLLLSAAAAGAFLIRQRSLHAELQLAREALAARRYGLARQRLTRLAERWTNDGEVFLLLGNAEDGLGKPDAMASWAKVPASSPYFGAAALARADYLIDNGHLAPAETILLEALADPARPGRFGLERALTRLLHE